MITNFLIGVVIVAAGWALFAFGRDWMNQDTRIPDTWRTDVLRWSVLLGVTALVIWWVLR